MLVGDTGFEPVTSSVSGQNFCSGMRRSVASGACAGSLMSAAVRLGWPTVWPTVNVAATSPASAGAEPSCAMDALLVGHRAGRTSSGRRCAGVEAVAKPV